MESVSEVDPNQVMSALLVPCHADATNAAMTVVIVMNDNSQRILRGPSASDFWRNYQPKQRAPIYANN